MRPPLQCGRPRRSGDQSDRQRETGTVDGQDRCIKVVHAQRKCPCVKCKHLSPLPRLYQEAPLTSISSVLSSSQYKYKSTASIASMGDSDLLSSSGTSTTTSSSSSSTSSNTSASDEQTIIAAAEKLLSQMMAMMLNSQSGNSDSSNSDQQQSSSDQQTSQTDMIS